MTFPIKIISASLFLALLGLNLAHAQTLTSSRSGWKKEIIHTRQGVQIEVDYQSVVRHDDEILAFANPVWINVTSNTKNLDAKSNISVVINNYIAFDGDTSNVQLSSAQNFSLSFAGAGRFTGPAQDLTILDYSDDGSGAKYISTIAVVVDGEWQINPNPISGSSYKNGDFLMDLTY